MKLKLIEKRNETSDIKTFIFKPDKPISWIAGQYLIYSLDHKNSDLRGKMRFFTISSPPSEKFPQITTRIVKKPSSFKKTLNNLKIGEELNAKGPDGDFIIEDFKKEYVFIAGGIGITPFISILKSLDNKKINIPIILFYSNHDTNILFEKKLMDLSEKNSKLKIKFIISPQRINKKFLQQNLNELKNKLIFISGPDPMVEELEKNLKELKIKEENIRSDYFSGYKD